jgi:hexosaminidase
LNIKTLLLPLPRHLMHQPGELALTDDRLILLDAGDAAVLRFTAFRLQQALQNHAAISWDLAASTAIPSSLIGAKLSLAPGATIHPQGYKLTITDQAIHAVASTPAGLFYAIATLAQLLAQYGRILPTLQISDWPDFPNRGVMLDISRDKVPTMETLYELVDLLASWKINQFQLYTEHTFAYRRHPMVWADASPMTGSQILALDAYCRQRFIELVPNQNSFGHLHRWLKHGPYLPLAEAPQGSHTPWNTYHDGPFSLAPTEPGSLNLVRDMFDELLPHFSSRQVNVGCDETFDIGQGKSKEIVSERGTGRVYLDFLLQIYREVKARGHTMQFWGDIIVQHPELVAELPRDLIALEWGYEADHPFDQDCATFAHSGVPFYVCPGTSSWNTVAGRTDNALRNLRNAAQNGLKHGAVGYLITDWGDNGHWQSLPVSFLGYGYGSGLAWAYEANRELDVASAISQFAFGDSSGVMGELVYELGNLYLEAGVRLHNQSPFFQILQLNSDAFGQYRAGLKTAGLDAAHLTQIISRVEAILAPLAELHLRRSDAAVIKEEYTWAAHMIQHACRRAIWILSEQRGQVGDPPVQSLADEADRLIEQYRVNWHARNRPGGFAESVARLERMRAQYSG